MTQKEQKNQIKNLLACAERLLCCMTEVQQDMDEAAKSIKQQKLLSDEIASKLENKLKELREETKNYTDICGETGIKNLMEASMSEAKHVLTEQLHLIEKEERRLAYKRFKSLQSLDPDTNEHILSYKNELKELLDAYEKAPSDEKIKKKLDAYSTFMQALDETDSAKVIAYILELSSVFDNQLLGKAFVARTIKEASEEREQTDIIVEESNDKPAKDNEAVEDAQLLSEIAAAKQLPFIRDEDVACYTLEIKKGKEEKKVGTKSFLNEIRAKFATENGLVLTCLDTFGVLSIQFLAIVTKKSMITLEMSFRYLFEKGYIRIYKIPGLDSFYSLSAKAWKVMQSREARNFLKIKGVVYDNQAKNEMNLDVDEESVNAAFARIAYLRLLNTFYEIIQPNTSMKEAVFDECFMAVLKDTSSIIMIGIFWSLKGSKDEEILLEHIRESVNYGTDYVIVAGLNRDYAVCNADYIVKEMTFDPKCVICYDLLKNEYFEYVSNDPFSPKKLLEKKENQSVKLESKAENKSENKEENKAENKVESKTESKSEDQLESKPESQSEDQSECQLESQFEDQLQDQSADASEDEIQNACMMIVEEKTYCATAYLDAVKDTNEQYKMLYEQLAYAVNDPKMRCSYDSHKIFAMYPQNEDILTNYLMLSTCLRNFFMNHIEYDYEMKALYENMKSIPMTQDYPELMSAAYRMVQFKGKFHKGIDCYADYRLRDQMKIEHRLENLAVRAKGYYESYVLGQPKNHKNVKRFVDTWKLVFAEDGEMASYLQAIMNGEYEYASLFRVNLLINFISDGCTAEYSNLNREKLGNYINDCWDKSKTNGGTKFKTSNLMSDLRNNLTNAMEKVIGITCEWIDLASGCSRSENDAGEKRYREIKSDLRAELKAAEKIVQKKETAEDIYVQAGKAVLAQTIKELLARLDGRYKEESHKYFYIDFLRGSDVLLDEEYFPDKRGNFADFEKLSLPARILRHSKLELLSFEEKLEHIFKEYGDDYGAAEQILDYMQKNRNATEEYNIQASKEQAGKDAQIRLNNFIENLELAQSYGQIEETKENKKEKIQKIANEWFAYADETKNYGFFKRILEEYEKKLHEDAKVRGEALLREVEGIENNDTLDECRKKRIAAIKSMIECQNYTVAEDLLSKINSEETDEEREIRGTDYLAKFIEEYDYNYKAVANSSKSLSDLAVVRIHNKDEKWAKRLIDNWMNNGQALGQYKLTALLEALGFLDAQVKEQAKLGRIENYIVTIPAVVGRKANYKHPIAAFGSKAQTEGFRVACLFGKYDADRLIEELKNMGNSKNTLVLLDYALSLPDRRLFAKKIKASFSDKVFAVIDRVLLMFLVNNYSVQFINQILMSVMMPFSYCQPYVWDSSKVMPPEIFIGRQEELEKIESPSGVNIVYGGRQLGKSALLKKAKMDIDFDENNNRAVYIEIKGMDYERAAKKICCELYDAGVLKEEIDTTDWDVLARAIKKRLLDDKEERIPYLLLLLDEADTFIESCTEVNFKPFDALKEIQNIGMDRFKFVIAGLHNIVRFKRDAALSNNSVITHLSSITIRPFHTKDARQLLEEPLYCLGFRFPKERQALISLILASTNYFPGLIQLYCANLIEAMKKDDYAGYDEGNTPAYEVTQKHIKKVLSDPSFMNQIREKFEITLKLDEDNMYYIIALLMAYLYHQNANSAADSEGFSAEDIKEAAIGVGINQVAVQKTQVINGLMQELLELNILRHTVNEKYLFSRYSFFQMMGTSDEIDSRLLEYMENQ